MSKLNKTKKADGREGKAKTRAQARGHRYDQAKKDTVHQHHRPGRQ